MKPAATISAVPTAWKARSLRPRAVRRRWRRTALRSSAGFRRGPVDALCRPQHQKIRRHEDEQAEEQDPRQHAGHVSGLRQRHREARGNNKDDAGRCDVPPIAKVKTGSATLSVGRRKLLSVPADHSMPLDSATQSPALRGKGMPSPVPRMAAMPAKPRAMARSRAAPSARRKSATPRSCSTPASGRTAGWHG